MESSIFRLLKDLLYKANTESIMKQIRNMNDPNVLHCFAANYNWDNGFDIPTAILENENCDLGTGLLMFYYSDGYYLLEKSEDFFCFQSDEWKTFILTLRNKIINLDFNNQDISFDPELTKIQMFKLRKTNPNIPDVLIHISKGRKIDIPKI
ncbi:DUF4274 domain-containing protein [Bacillus paramycoides]|uniref:DUF4274 domain-containing protein n=1 Tax=Bacillus paramycoides TaxID=2026194 RepID=UPI002E24F81C|nr:DUF4274 domain-containing protein [Bacillus paramycoides]